MRTSADIANLLVVSRDLGVLRSLSTIKASTCWRFETASDTWEAMEHMRAGASPQLLMLDSTEGAAECLDMLRWMRRVRPSLPVILIGRTGDEIGEEQATRLGAKAYLTRPLDERQLATVIEESLPEEAEADDDNISSDDIEALGDESYFVAMSPQMRTVRAKAALLAEASVPVLIVGEAGTGKETVARLMHKLSVRSGFNFTRVSCAALPADLLEREIFGYETAGATAAATIKHGKIDLCARGSIYLEDIHEMPATLQSCILRLIREKRFMRPGASGFTESDVRIFAASEFNGKRKAPETMPRSELIQHISANSIHLPPLRERREGIAQLARHFMHRLARHYGLPPREFSPAIIEAWRTYEWPGNLSEMEDLVKRYLMVGDEELATGFRRPVTESVEGRSGAGVLARSEAAGLSPSLADAMASGSKSLRSLLKGVRSEAERNAIAMALEKTGGNRKAAARLLKVSYRTVLYKIEEYKMIPPATSQSGKLDAAQNPTRDGSDSTRSVGPAGKRLVDGRKELR